MSGKHKKPVDVLCHPERGDSSVTTFPQNNIGNLKNKTEGKPRLYMDDRCRPRTFAGWCPENLVDYRLSVIPYAPTSFGQLG
jgi:hypothetical protein